jgi:hypothetical protein
MRPGFRLFVPIIAAIFAGCGGVSITSPTPTPSPPPPLQPPIPLLLRTLYRVVVNGTDRMTTFGPSERTAYPLDAEVFYTPDASATGTTGLDRLLSAGGADHADGLGLMNGYTIEETLGYPWSTAGTGLTQILEASNNVTGDHAMVSPSENLVGYDAQPLAAYAFPRYGNVGEVLLTTSAGGVTVESNAVAGGVLWRWTWNGVEFIDHPNYGGAVQSAFYYPGQNQDWDPNEAGDEYPIENPMIAHGSPILRFESKGNTQYTRAIPLNWLAEPFGGDKDHPVIWNQIVIGKDLTLNYMGLGAVAQYTSHLILPTTTYGVFANPAGSILSSFARFWTYSSVTKTLTEVTSQLPNGCTDATTTNFGGYAYFPTSGGIIMSDAAGANAMGIYGVNRSEGGSITYFAMWKFYCWGDGPGEDAKDSTAWSAVYGNGSDVVFPSGESIYNVYIITDSLQNVTAQMDKLYAMAAK